MKSSNSPKQAQSRRLKVTAQQTPKPPAVQITPEFVLDVVRRWWKISFPVGLLLGALAACFVYLTFTPIYQAKVLLYIAERQPYLVDPTYSDQNYVRNQIGLIRSPLVLGPAL